MSFASLDDYLNPDAFASASSNAAESGSAPATASTSTAAQTLDPALFSSTSDLLDFGNAASSSTGDSVNYADLFRQYSGTSKDDTPFNPYALQYTQRSGAAPGSTGVSTGPSVSAPASNIDMASIDPSNLFAAPGGSPIGLASPASVSASADTAEEAPEQPTTLSFSPLDSFANGDMVDYFNQDGNASPFGAAAPPAFEPPVFDADAADADAADMMMREDNESDNDKKPDISTASPARKRGRSSTATTSAVTRDDDGDEDDAEEDEDEEFRPTRRSARATNSAHKRTNSGASKARNSARGSNARNASKGRAPSATPAHSFVDTIRDSGSPDIDGSRKAPRTSVSQFAGALHATNTAHAGETGVAGHPLAPVPDWLDRPDDDSYAKLSSREKRQLRNKISARNFRHRRKEYITTLEEEISTRDNLISKLQSEVSVVRDENRELKTEIVDLKQAWADLMRRIGNNSGAEQKTSVGQVGVGVKSALATGSAAEGSSNDAESTEWPLMSPRPTSSSSSNAQARPAAPSRAPSSSQSITTPNLAKDVAPSRASARQLARANRSGGTGAGMSFGSSFMAVHSTFLPEVNFLSAKGAAPASTPAPPTANFNPAINALNEAQRSQWDACTQHLHNPTAPTFFENNPYILRGAEMDEYRRQLWGKLSHNAAGALNNNKGSMPPGSFRPAFFRQNSGSNGNVPTSQLLNEKRSASPGSGIALPPTLDEREQQLSSHNNLDVARVAQVAQSTLVSRILGAFADAFTGDVPTPAGSHFRRNAQTSRGQDMADVLAGRARLQVVRSNSTTLAPPAPAAQASGVDALGEQLNSLALDQQPRQRSSSEPPASQSSFCSRWTSRR